MHVPATRHNWRARLQAGRRRDWSPASVAVVLALANLLLALSLFAVRSPWARPAADAVPPALLAQIRELQARIAAGQHGQPYTLALSDAELTAAAAYYAATSPGVPFTRVRLAVTGDGVSVDAVTRALAVPVPVHATVLLTAREGVPSARIADVRVAGAGLPAVVHDEVLREANASLDLSRYDLPLTVDALELHAGGLTMSGTLK